MDQYKFPHDPVAHPASVVSGPNYRFTLIDSRVLRYEWAEDGQFEDRASAFALNRRFPTPEFQVTETDDELVIHTPTLHLSYDKKRFSPNGLLVSFYGKVNLWGSEWRYGGGQGNNLGGTARTLDNVDGRCDMGLGILSRDGYAVVDDSETLLFEENGFVAPRRQGDRVDGYIFAYGFEFKAAMKSFYAISGHQPILPRWILGNWWSRYHPYTAESYLELMDKFKKFDTPLSVAVIDMDWHLVHGDKVPHAGWTGYTWNKDLFPDHVEFCNQLKARKLKVTLNDHPHAGIHSHEEAYEEMAAALGHDTSNKAPILFNPTSQKFMHAYFNILHRRLEKEGCDFWWIDWQQGPYSRVTGLDPLWLLNHYHFLDHGQQSKDGKAVIFSRYAGPGSHRYPVGFSGDSAITWASLQFQSEFTATASNIGYGWWSHDIGGHMGGYRDDELTTRWVQLGVFSPLMRLHSSHSMWSSKEPWLYRSEHDVVMRAFLRFRHRLVPYLHTMNARAANEDEPVVQPLYWSFPDKNEAYNNRNQYFFGDSLVMSPIVQPRNKTTNLAAVDTWVPPGRYVDILSGLVYEGDRQIKMYRSLSKLPALALEGSIIPLDGSLSPENGCPNPESFEVLVIIGKDGKFILREDDEDEPKRTLESGPKHREIQIDYQQKEGRLSVAASGRHWAFRFPAITVAPPNLKVTSDGANIPNVEVGVGNDVDTPGLVVRVPKQSPKAKIVVDLGPNPILSAIDRPSRLNQLLLDFQIPFDLKDKIWQLCDSQQAVGVKVGGLMRLGLEEDVLGPVVELLVCDNKD